MRVHILLQINMFVLVFYSLFLIPSLNNILLLIELIQQIKILLKHLIYLFCQLVRYLLLFSLPLSLPFFLHPSFSSARLFSYFAHPFPSFQQLQLPLPSSFSLRPLQLYLLFLFPFPQLLLHSCVFLFYLIYAAFSHILDPEHCRIIF